MADAGERSLDHRNMEPTVSLMYNQANIHSFATINTRISVPNKYVVCDFFIPVGTDANSIGLVEIVVCFVACVVLITSDGVQDNVKNLDDRTGVTVASILGDGNLADLL